MNDIDFFNSFHFNEFFYSAPRHVDNSDGVPWHFLGYLKQGHGLIVAKDRRLELHAGDLFYIPHRCRYHSYWTPDGTVRFDSLGFSYLPSTEQYALQKIHCDEALLQKFMPLSRDKSVTMRSVGLLYSVLGELQPQLETVAPTARATLTDRAILYMTQTPNASIAQIAQACGISEATLYNAFRYELGKTPNAVRLDILCKQAVELLTATDLSVEEISNRCGVSSASYFRKILRSVTGKTPREIRKQAELI